MNADFKTKYWYSFEEQTFQTPDGDCCQGFNILAFCGKQLVYRAENAFTTQSVAEEFVNNCNSQGLELCQLADVLEDRLCVLPL